MSGIMAGPKLLKKLERNPKVLIVLSIALIVIVLIAYLFFQFQMLISNYHVQINRIKSFTSAYVIQSSTLFYNQSQYIAPYVLVHYESRNATNLYMNASLYKYPIPQKIYILNTTDECIYCNNVSAVLSNMYEGLVGYKLIQNPNQIEYINIDSVLSIPNNSILVVLNGLLPEQFFAKVNNNTNETVLDQLLNKGTSILYVGKSFNNVLLPGSIIIPNNNMTSFLFTNQTSRNSTFYDKVKNSTLENLYFYNQTYTFNKTDMGSVSYENVSNGSIVGFFNYVDFWPPKYAGLGLAKSISELFWLPKYASGNETLAFANLSRNSSGNIGIVLNDTSIQIYKKAYLKTSLNISPETMVNTLNQNGYLRVLAYTSKSYLIGNNSTYVYASYKPHYSINGSVGVPIQAIPGQTIPINITLFTNSSTQVRIAPHIVIYDRNMTPITSQPISFFYASGNFSFLVQKPFSMVPGTYIISLQGITGSTYADAFVSVPAFNITVKRYLNNTFTLELLAGKTRLNNINYTITVNKKYPSSGIIYNGNITYMLPNKTQPIYGKINLSISMLSHEFNVSFTNSPINITISSSDIDLIIVVIIVVIMVVAIRAPSRDEFYIDIPSLPKQQNEDIKLKPNAIVETFDKLNLYYHWKYMPLSIEEVRTAIINNIKYRGMPVAITYNNAEAILDELSGLGYLVSTDELYAPQQWISETNYDIEYLATFKKLRIWFVMHAYMFTDIGVSTTADTVATIKNERAYIVIYSKTSKFINNVPIYPNVQTYIAFLNSERMYDFKDALENLFDPESEKLKLYIASEKIKFIDSDDPRSAFQ